MRFAPYYLLGDTSNLIVDGNSNKSTVCNLSHWPHSGTRQELKDDLSAQIVFHYLDRPDLHVDVEAVSNDHFDEDGLVGLYSVLNPAQAQKDRELLIDIANVGDFAKYRLREAARVAFVLAAYADQQESPLDPGLFSKPYSEYTAEMYQIMLPLLPEIIQYPEKYQTFWEREEAFLDESENAIRNRQVQIDEIPEIDLAIVTLPADAQHNPAHKLTSRLSAVCHPIAIHNATDCFRILLMQGRRYQLYYRYETWIQYMSKRLILRADLTKLAEILSKQEDGNSQWTFTGVEKMDAHLYLTNASASKIMPADFSKQVKSFLSDAPPAWDPYDPQ